MSAFGRAMLSEWRLDPEVTYLNHGTVGAPPRRVLDAQQAIRDDIEREPARFQLRELADVGEVPMRVRPRMRVAAEAVAEFLGTSGDSLVFVDNSTAGVNAVLQSFPFAPGDEILVTDHGYGAVALAAAHVAKRTGAAVRTIALPYPRFDDEAITDAIAAAFGPRTRLLVVDHVTSGTALVLPVAAICRSAHAAGVAVLVDGAHAPGALPLAVPAIGADWYTGNLHKWAMAPRSSGVLWAAPGRERDLHPTVISWGYGRGFAAEFDLLGTRDPSPWLAAPDGIAFMRALGLDAMRAHGHALVWDSVQRLADRWDVALPMRESQVGMMATMTLPERFGTSAEHAWRLKDALLYEDRIEAQIHAWHGRVWLRLSGQVYNDERDIERLVQAMEARA